MKTHSSAGLYPFWINMVPDVWYPYWMWADGTDANFTKWYNNTRPRDDKSCIAWRTAANDDGWIPISCKYSQPFICKQASRTCPTVSLNGTSGNLTSPNYPRPYPLDSNCVYHITVPAGNIVRLQFDYVDLDYLDKFVFYDGPDLNSPKFD
uniref:Uncharacterized protein n=1 Tax=Panagrolaimus sp. JU765 TaxID=591449 RepID=A0AC34RRP0_9BILA